MNLHKVSKITLFAIIYKTSLENDNPSCVIASQSFICSRAYPEGARISKQGKKQKASMEAMEILNLIGKF